MAKIVLSPQAILDIAAMIKKLPTKGNLDSVCVYEEEETGRVGVVYTDGHAMIHAHEKGGRPYPNWCGAFKDQSERLELFAFVAKDMSEALAHAKGEVRLDWSTRLPEGGAINCILSGSGWSATGSGWSATVPSWSATVPVLVEPASTPCIPLSFPVRQLQAVLSTPYLVANKNLRCVFSRAPFPSDNLRAETPYYLSVGNREFVIMPLQHD